MNKHVLDNGVRFLAAPFDGPRSVSVGVWMIAGSRFEGAKEGGVAHALEHMLFKGTPRRSCYQIALESNALGSHINAYTSQEAICLHARVVDEKLTEAVDLLADLFNDSVLDGEEFNRERNVILEEVMMYEDTPDERVGDLFTETLWSGHALGRPILGDSDGLRKMRVEQLDDFRSRLFQPDRVVVAVAGAFDEAACVGLLNEKFGLLSATEAPIDNLEAPVPVGAVNYISRPLEQVHFCVGVVTPPRKSEERYPMALLNLILGGGMSSRLFQEVREKRGLAYAIGSYSQTFTDAGYLALYGGAGPDQIEQTLDICWRETSRVCREDVTEEELRNAKEMLRASLLLSLESTNARMTQLADQDIYLGRFVSIEETLEKIDAVTIGNLRVFAEKYIAGKSIAAAYIGPEKLESIVGDRGSF